MKILFVCKYNRFRSKVAESIFNKLNKNKNIICESAGVLADTCHLHIEQNVINIMNEKGYNIPALPRQATKKLTEKFDALIIVADDVNPEYFFDFSGKILCWPFKDCDGNDIKKIKEIINSIEDKIKDFIKNLD